MTLAPGSKLVYFPPPSRGINALDAYWDMDPRFALELTNIRPQGSFNQCRLSNQLLGTSAAAAPVAGQGVKMYPLNLANGTTIILCIGDNQAKFVTTAGVWTDLGALSSTSNFCQFRNKLFGAGPTATPQTFDGAAFVASGWTGSGLTATNLHSPWVYRGRLWFCEEATRNAWYADIDQIAGAPKALTKFPLESIFVNGGTIHFGASISPPNSEVGQSLNLFVSNMGEVVVYTGQDPGASDWAFYGRYFLAPPIARNSWFYIGNVFHIITKTSIVPMDNVLSGKREGANYQSISKYIDPILIPQFNTTQNFQFDQAAVSPRENLLYISFSSTTFYVFDLITQQGAWSSYLRPSSTDLNSTYTKYSGAATAGSDTYFIMQKLNGGTYTWTLWKVGQSALYDDFGGGFHSPIPFLITSAFSNFGDNKNKKFNKWRPLAVIGSSASWATATEFNLSYGTNQISSNFPVTMNKKFYDLNKEAMYIALVIAGSSNDSGATVFPQYHGSLLSYQPGSDVP